MRNYLVFILVFFNLLFAATAYAQPKSKKLLVRSGCNMADEVVPGEYEAIESSKEMKAVYDEIMGVYKGAFRPIIQLVASGNAKNAVATEVDGIRYIIYNEVFLQNFKVESLTSWAARYLLAHEIGHHVLGHKFGGKAIDKSHQDELAADEFAARIMVHLGADLSETLAGIKTFDLDKGSTTHPSPKLREQVIAQAWHEESAKTTADVPAPNPPGTVTPSTAKFTFTLDESAYKSPWNLIKSAKADIDNEKVVIYFSLDSKYATRKYRVCIKSNNASVQPGRNNGSVSGTDPNKPIPYSQTMQIVWNYRIDKYDQRSAGMPENLRVYVYDVANEPQKPGAGGNILGWTLCGIGAGAVGYGIVEMSNGLNIYNNTYMESRLASDYDAADEKYVNGQVFIAGGIILAGAGAWILIKNSKRKNEYKKSVCYETYRWQIEPVIVSANSLGAGFRLRF